MTKYIYDLETYPNFFLATFKRLNKDEWWEFEISDRKNDCERLYEFIISGGKRYIGFNNINFDYPVLHNTLLAHRKNWKAGAIYKEVEKIIKADYSEIAPWYIKMPQIDLFKIWHYDNKHKSTSLKWLEFAMRMRNIEDLPYAVGSILNDEQKDKVISYCRNDIDATQQFFNKSLKHLELREFYSRQENMDLVNTSEIKLSKAIFGKYLSKEMGIDIKELKKLRSYRDSVSISEIVLPYIKFEDPVNQLTLKTFRSKKWLNPEKKDSFDFAVYNQNKIKFSVPYKNVVREYAEGGLHSFGNPGVYKSDDEYILVDVDFASYYPHLSFQNGLHPEHIPGEIFNRLYKGFYTERKKYPKSDPRNYVLKIMLNGSYGLSKDKYSFLYDPKWQLAITVNGQLLLTLLTEKILNAVPDAKIIFENTDGAMYRVKRTSYNALVQACKEVEQLTSIALETEQCEKIIARDVNNYINVIDSGNMKFKGCFELDRDYHKNHSKRIVGLALANYFIHGTSVESFIFNYLSTNTTNIGGYDHHGIHDFCIGAKMKGKNKLYGRSIDGVRTNDLPLGKVTRYYVSKRGTELIKKLPPLEKNYVTDTDKQPSNQTNIFQLVEDVKIPPKERETSIESGYNSTIMNVYEDKEDYGIDYDYYINEVNKIIRTVENKNRII